ncbi:MAG: hypothetical protein FJ137_21540 [Deltaproteobacteria bacterium]|nr:hypothetical protein [Deltaproteobacteria bacterium]
MRSARSCVVVVVALALVAGAARADVDLGIAPVQQATPVWCWLAVGEMLFRKLDVPAVNGHYQCGVIAAMSLATNQAQCAQDCRLCAFPAGNASTLMGMLIGYPRRAALLSGRRAPRLFVSHADALSPRELRHELEAGRPVVAGINPQGAPAAFAASAHVSLITGYAERDAALWLLVNDPFPFSPSTWPDPYLQAGAKLLRPGQYAVPYDTYTRQLGWVESFVLRVDGAHPPAGRQCFASTPLSQQRCPAPPLAQPGDACACGPARGVVVDGT